MFFMLYISHEQRDEKIITLLTVTACIYNFVSKGFSVYILFITCIEFSFSAFNSGLPHLNVINL